MKKHMYGLGILALALAMSGVPTASVHAEDAAVTAVSATAEVTNAETVAAPAAVNTDSTARPVDPRILMEQKRELLRKQAEQVRALKEERRAIMASSSEGAPLDEQALEELKQKAEQVREESKQQMEQIREERKQQMELVRESVKDRLELLREGTTTPARSVEQLKKMIKERRMEIRGGLASTSPSGRKAFEHAGEVSVAVHALLASRDLLDGGIGQKVSEIAKSMNDSVASTTSVEAGIQSRGLFSKILFGGDKRSAEAIAAQVEQNKTRLETLAGLLAEASTTEEVRATLDAQVQAMQAEQDRLKSVAEKQSKLWGLFSWRF